MAEFTNLIYGSTGSGKSALLAGFAKALWEQEKKKTRLVCFERAQTEPQMREGIEAGYVLPWWINARMDAQGNVEVPFEQFTDAVLGKWPEDLQNPYSKLIPAFAINYRVLCKEVEKHTDKKDKLIYQSEKAPEVGQKLKCPCGNAPIVETVRVLADKRLEEVGAYFIEGLTEGGDVMMNNMSQRAAKGEQMGGGDRGGVSVRFQDGALWVAGSTQASYGIAQRQCKNKVDESKHLPVKYVWWTATLEEGKDFDKGGVMVFGPKIPGTAATADVARWFGTSLCAMSVPVDAEGKVSETPKYRLYLQEFFQSWIPLIAKQKVVVNNRIPAHKLKGIPQFVAVDYEKGDEVVVAGQKLRLETLLYGITKLIESRQVPQRDLGVANTAAAPLK